MDNSFFAYLQRLELIAFFSGYPLIYVITQLIAGNQTIRNLFKINPALLLSFAYTLVGTLFLGLQLRNLYPEYSIAHLKEVIQQPYLVAWALLSLLFWIPMLAKKPVLSLLHSLVFFFLFAKDLFLQLTLPSADKNILRNNMKLYTESLLLNAGAFLLILLFSLLLFRLKRKKLPKVN